VREEDDATNNNNDEERKVVFYCSVNTLTHMRITTGEKKEVMNVFHIRVGNK